MIWSVFLEILKIYAILGGIILFKCETSFRLTLHIKEVVENLIGEWEHLHGIHWYACNETSSIDAHMQPKFSNFS